MNELDHRSDWNICDSLDGVVGIAVPTSTAKGSGSTVSTQQADAVWTELYRRQWRQIERWVVDEFLQGVEILGLLSNRVRTGNPDPDHSSENRLGAA